MKRAIYRIWLVAAVMALSLMGSDDGRLWAQGAPKTPAVVELPNEVDPLTVVGRITVVEPQDYQVFQRFYGTQGTIRLRGTAHALLKLQYRLIGPAADGKALDGEWHDVEVSPSKGDPIKVVFDVPISAPAGGWYKLHVLGMLNGLIREIAIIEHVGVGDTKVDPIPVVVPLTGAVPLTVVEPQDYQVFQRANGTEGTIRLRGSAHARSKVQYRLIGQATEGKSLDGEWHDVEVSPSKGEPLKAVFDVPISAPAGGWYKLHVRGMGNGLMDGLALDKAEVQHVGVGEVFLVVGQPNSANYGQERLQTETKRVAAFNGEKWALADDPLVTKFNVPVGIVAVGQGSTSVREWLPKGEKVEKLTATGLGLMPSVQGKWESDGILFERIAWRLDTLGPHGFRAILWHQGESDAGQARSGTPSGRQISGDDYFRYMQTLIKASRAKAGWDVPWFTAQATYHSEQDPADEELRAAQKKVWDVGLALPGPDTDVLRAEFRHGVHFNAKGLVKHGQLWADKITPWLEKQLDAKSSNPLIPRATPEHAQP